MIRALYAASSGLVAQTVKQDVIAHNIANAQTPGFKGRKRLSRPRSRMSWTPNCRHQASRAAHPYPDSPVSARKVLMDSAVDNTQGPIRETGLKTDLAIAGPALSSSASMARPTHPEPAT